MSWLSIKCYLKKQGVSGIKGIEYIQTLPVEKLAKVLIRSCPSDIGMKNAEGCPGARCVNCWAYALESEIDIEAVEYISKIEY